VSLPIEELFQKALAPLQDLSYDEVTVHGVPADIML
jgi:hypothetical protein